MTVNADPHFDVYAALPPASRFRLLQILEGGKVSGTELLTYIHLSLH